MGAMVRLGNHALKAENTSTFIGMIFGSVLVQEKRNFDRLMNSYVQVINDSRLPRKAKSGILVFVTDFEVSWRQVSFNQFKTFVNFSMIGYENFFVGFRILLWWRNQFLEHPRDEVIWRSGTSACSPPCSMESFVSRGKVARRLER